MGADRPEHATGGTRSEEPLEALFHALEGPLLGYAQRLVKDSELSQDMVQEAFMRLHSQAPGQVREPRSWLYRTIHNLALNHLRSASRLRPLSGTTEDEAGVTEDAVDLQPLPDEQLARWESIGLVRIGMQGLDPRSRELVRLRFQEDCSYREIAERTGLTVGHVGYLLHHALKTLGADLSQAGLIP